MTFDEAKVLLSRITILDNRKVDAASIVMWQEVLAPYSIAEALWALREFARSESQEYLRPAHLVSIIHRKRREFADANPGRSGLATDAWLQFESELDRAVIAIQEIRARRHMYAVDAMEREDGDESDG